jgi:hypothetical protein
MKTKEKQLQDKLQYALKSIKWITATSRAILKFLAGINRAINPGHVSNLSKSYERMGSLQPIICCEVDFITGKKELYVIEGQHRTNVLIRQGWDIPYIVIDIKDKKDLIETIALLNTSSKSWTLQDYVNSWASLEEDYIKLNRYFQIYDVEMNIVAAILSNGSVAGGGAVTKKIKSGDFKIQDEKENVKILDGLMDILKIIPRMNRYENRYVCAEYVNFRRTSGCDYNHNVFIKNLNKNKEKFILATQGQEKLADMFRKLTK